jgi:glycosyltransferase involved in cell wall biosynthesis
MRRFLPDNRILWVNTIGLRPPKLSRYDIRRAFEKLSGWIMSRQKGVVLPENLWVVAPVSIPYNMIAPIRWVNAKLGCATVCREMKRRQFHDPIVITTLPNTVDLVGAIGDAMSIYYCVDEFTSYPDLPTKMIGSMEQELLGKVDLVIATARELQKRKNNGRLESQLVPHGVDVDHYASARHRGMPPPAVMEKIPHPIVGFFGVLGDWVDLPLIDCMAEMRPDWSWVLIGPAQTDIAFLKTRSNIHLLGRIDYQELPQYAVQFDVGMIPFVINDLTINVNPLKLLEYLACGLPVVSTSLPEVVRYGAMVEIADTSEAFVVAIERVLAMNSSGRVQERMAVAAQSSWEARAEQFSHCIEQLIASGGGHA